MSSTRSGPSRIRPILSVDQALEVAQRVRPEQTYFTHIAHELSHSAEADLPANTFIAYDGLKLEL